MKNQLFYGDNLEVLRKYIKDETVKVHRTVDYIPKYGYVETEPKTAAGRRTLLLPAFVVEMLKEHRTHQLEAKLKAGDTWENRDLVFTGFKREVL